ncbi:hypothetical protein [Streptomyces peucetius]|uniref:Serine/threonine protein kinase n=1 Tax=Streptomyces peucetius TaxID=1950 RepID=A0ABY6IG45_STRPE|nr:hypothetical protein [Streptomyces peucetius]UYQ65969.1 hypothetical protein OGH68_33920 [Streptomyces peucetius]
MSPMVGSVTRDRYDELVKLGRDRVATMSSVQWRLGDAAVEIEPMRSSDLFAWGALVTQAATGRLPFGAGAPEGVASRLTPGRPPLNGSRHGRCCFIGGILVNSATRIMIWHVGAVSPRAEGKARGHVVDYPQSAGSA